MDECLSTQTLIDVVDGRANPEARTHVEEHASRCASCRGVLSSLARTGTPICQQPVRAPRADLELAPNTQVGRYVISHQVGAGGIGVVYAARDPELGRAVAVKVLRSDRDPELQERLRREAIAMAQLAHPNVVAVHDVGTFDGRTFIAMEYVAGETLGRWLATPRSPRAILEVCCAAGAGLAAAHAAGIVHRDFKPENVMIGNDGRVRVGDFGLARSIGGSAAAEPASAAAMASPQLQELTAPGTLIGTPYYVAPELYRGAEADARSDQFSFCVAVFFALYGQRPFDGKTLEELRANVDRGQIHVPQRARRLPRPIRAALQRGLAADPDARFASLGALLSALARPPRRVALGLLAAGGVLAVIALPFALWMSDRPDERCTGAAAAFAGAWNPARRIAITAAFQASRAPFAADALDRVGIALDRYALHWRDAHTDACRATRIHGEQTEAVLDLRMTCLERRRQDAAALIDALASADRAAIARAVDAVLGLPDIAPCADIAALRQVVPPPDDPATRARIAALTTRMAEVRAQQATGAFTRARELVLPIATEVRALGYRPFEAEVEFTYGELEGELGDLASAERHLDAAIWAAEAGRNDEVAARSWTKLVFLVGYERADFARGRALVPRATAAIARLGGNAAMEGRVEAALSGIAYRLGEFDDAVAHSERALVLAERAYGPEHIRLAKARESNAIMVQIRGDFELAVNILNDVLRTYERELGPHHPSVANALLNLSAAHERRRDYAPSEAAARRALAIREAVLGADHRLVAHTLGALASKLRYQGKLDDALAAARRAIAIVERLPNRDDYIGVNVTAELGIIEARLHRAAEADHHTSRALALARKLLGPDGLQTMTVVAQRCNALVLQDRWREAAPLCRQAIPILERERYVRDDLHQAMFDLARTDVELGQPARAVAPLEQLAGALDEQPPYLRLSVELMLARALWDSGGDRARARRFAEHALAASAQLPGTSVDDLRLLERWLASHRAR